MELYSVAKLLVGKTDQTGHYRSFIPIRTARGSIQALTRVLLPAERIAHAWVRVMVGLELL